MRLCISTQMSPWIGHVLRATQFLLVSVMAPLFFPKEAPLSAYFPVSLAFSLPFGFVPQCWLTLVNSWHHTALLTLFIPAHVFPFNYVPALFKPLLSLPKSDHFCETIVDTPNCSSFWDPAQRTLYERGYYTWLLTLHFIDLLFAVSWDMQFLFVS